MKVDIYLCGECQNQIKGVFESFTDIKLGFPKVEGQKYYTIKECLGQYFGDNVVTGIELKCVNCQLPKQDYHPK